jgi:hypothetical protein
MTTLQTNDVGTCILDRSHEKPRSRSVIRAEIVASITRRQPPRPATKDADPRRGSASAIRSIHTDPTRDGELRHGRCRIGFLRISSAISGKLLDTPDHFS